MTEYKVCVRCGIEGHQSYSCKQKWFTKLLIAVM